MDGSEQRDYEEESFWAAEAAREARMEEEHEKQCPGCDYCCPPEPVIPEMHEGHPRVWPNYIDYPDF